ncbi:DUF192 domain-containing protein [Halorubrum sp. BV1]|uniref:DUF192 domain-containing protein n=1 Tax=Halorubrum sp. BV1 TaxID=1498500 RepID=UPI00067991E9|nr:DUF192 domain-containing protein [Halorubrum sp. BV1]
MRRRGYLTATGAAALCGLAGCVGGGSEGSAESDETPDWPVGPYADYETTRVAVEGPDGEARGSVTAAVANTSEERYLGLSDAEALPENAGMLFVYDAPRESLTYVMREMDFGIDIVYADGDREITRMHNAPAPGPNEDGNDQRYPGSGQYVLEVPYEWTDRNGVGVGDSVAFEL